MFRGDQIQVELYASLIDGMVKSLTSNKFPEYRTLGKYLQVWGLTSHKKKGREYKEAVQLRLAQEEFFTTKNVKWLLIEKDIEIHYAEKLVENLKYAKNKERETDYDAVKKLKEDKIKTLLQTDSEKTTEIMQKITKIESPRRISHDRLKKQSNWEPLKAEFKADDYSPYNLFTYIANEEEDIDKEIEKALKKIDGDDPNAKEDEMCNLKKKKASEMKRDRWKKSPHCSIKTGGRDRLIFGLKNDLKGPDKRELIKTIPNKFEECIDQLLTSQSPLRIAFLRIMTREYLLQFTKYACSPIKNEPNYSDDSIDIVKSFGNGPCKDFKDNLERLSEEFNLMGENIARDEIEEYVKVFDEVIEFDKKEKGPKLVGEKIRDRGRMIQKILIEYVLEERPNSKLYFPRKYPRITKL